MSPTSTSTRRTLARPVATAVAAAALLLVGSSVAGASGSGASWSYSGTTGPEFWGQLDHAYAACADGTQQSPIDITTAVREPVTNPKIVYVPGIATVFNNGHTVEAEANPGSSILLNGVTYNLAQIHFHAQSEHEVDGRHFPVEVHFVHKSASGAAVVISVLLEEGKRTNRAWQPYVDALSVPEGEEVHAHIDWAALLPVDRRNYRYAGSLTTPPCTQAVSWIVMARPVPVSGAQIAAFDKAYDHNYRPVQPLNDRTVVFDISAG